MKEGLSLKDQCKGIFYTLRDLLNQKKIDEANDYILSFISEDKKLDPIAQVSLLKSILVMTYSANIEPIKSSREKVKKVFDSLMKDLENRK